MSKLRTALDRNNFESARLEGVRVSDTVSTGFIEGVGAGMGSAYIPFPMSFDERPVMFFTFEFGEGSTVGGEYPHLSVSIYGWDIEEISADMQVYKGVTVLISLRGDGGVKGMIHWVAMGKTFTNPVRNMDVLD